LKTPIWSAASGLLLAIYYRHQGPVRPQSTWENEPEEEDSSEADWNQPEEEHKEV